MLGILIHFDLAANSHYFRLSLLLTRAPFHSWMLLTFLLPLHLQERIFSELIVITKLILVMPATNASSERYFSALRRIKTYICNTMNQERLNHLMLLYIHKDQTDLLNLCDVGNDFVCGHENCLSMFGKF